MPGCGSGGAAPRVAAPPAAGDVLHGIFSLESALRPPTPHPPQRNDGLRRHPWRASRPRGARCARRPPERPQRGAPRGARHGRRQGACVRAPAPCRAHAHGRRAEATLYVLAWRGRGDGAASVRAPCVVGALGLRMLSTAAPLCGWRRRPAAARAARRAPRTSVPVGGRKACVGGAEVGSRADGRACCARRLRTPVRPFGAVWCRQTGARRLFVPTAPPGLHPEDHASRRRVWLCVRAWRARGAPPHPENCIALSMFFYGTPRPAATRRRVPCARARPLFPSSIAGLARSRSAGRRRRAAPSGGLRPCRKAPPQGRPQALTRRHADGEPPFWITAAPRRRRWARDE